MALGLDMAVMTVAFGMAYYFGRNEEVSLIFKYMFILSAIVSLFEFLGEYGAPIEVQVLFWLAITIFFVFLLIDVLKLMFTGVKVIAANFRQRFKL